MAKTYEVTGIGPKGDGVVDMGDTTLFVPKVVLGEKISIQDKRLLKIIESSPERAEAFCPHYNTCGGCKFQHWKETPYRAWKEQRVTQALSAVGITTKIEPMVDAHGAGRRRITLHVREVEGKWVSGFMAEKSHELSALQSCPVLEPNLQNAPSWAGRFGEPLGPCDVMITLGANGFDVAVKAERSAVTKRLGILQKLFDELKLNRLSVNGEVLFANETPFVMMSGVKTTLPIAGFLQATREGENKLVELVLAAVPKKAKNIADLFCGIGPFTFALAKQARVFASDSEKPAIGALELAKRHAQGLKPITSMVRDLHKNPLTSAELKEFDCVVLDPPRAGAEVQTRNIAKAKIKTVISVSCDVQTFARDAKTLLDYGYKLKKLTPVDQFKWTPHVELVGTFEISP